MKEGNTQTIPGIIPGNAPAIPEDTRTPAQMKLLEKIQKGVAARKQGAMKPKSKPKKSGKAKSTKVTATTLQSGLPGASKVSGWIDIKAVDALDIDEDRLVTSIYDHINAHKSLMRTVGLRVVNDMGFQKHNSWPRGLFESFMEGMLEMIEDKEFIRDIVHFHQISHRRANQNTVLSTALQVAATNVFWSEARKLVYGKRVRMLEAE